MWVGNRGRWGRGGVCFLGARGLCLVLDVRYLLLGWTYIMYIRLGSSSLLVTYLREYLSLYVQVKKTSKSIIRGLMMVFLPTHYRGSTLP